MRNWLLQKEGLEIIFQLDKNFVKRQVCIKILVRGKNNLPPRPCRSFDRLIQKQIARTSLPFALENIFELPIYNQVCQATAPILRETIVIPAMLAHLHLFIYAADGDHSDSLGMWERVRGATDAVIPQTHELSRSERVL